MTLHFVPCCGATHFLSPGGYTGGISPLSLSGSVDLSVRQADGVPMLW